ncbi:hypothetical protein TrVFT333_008694 [Trichoderma virens FT-333]|nr:hypothetical protein TrVFT333_008694 [Trichoderma virens FT-333]
MASGSTCEAAAIGVSSSPPSSLSSILFQSSNTANNNDSPSFVLLDIPRSLEEAQVPPATSPLHASSPGLPARPLMAAAAAQSALDELRSRYSGPFCLDRVCRPAEEAVFTDGDVDVHVDAANADAAGAKSSEASRIRIPIGAEYLHGSIYDLRQTFVDTAPHFRLVILDPPWPNRSVRRKRKTGSYSTASNLTEIQQLLLSIPVSLHLTPDGLVAVWITNKSSIFDLVTSPRGLFASWGLELMTQWTWLKVTSSGDPIFDMESAWRKPWETLLIAKRIGARAPSTLKPLVIVAVPDVHSRKPNLRQLFEGVLGRDYTALEVFARNLTSGWWSWGDQVLHFQGTEHWIQS